VTDECRGGSMGWPRGVRTLPLTCASLMKLVAR